MELLDRFGTDPEAVSKGAWITLEADVDGTVVSRVLLARMNNHRYREAMAARLRTLRGEPSDAEAKQYLTEVMCETILLGWEGLTVDGEEFPYSKENALQLLSDERLSDFKDWVVGQANLMDNYRIQRLEDDSGK